MKGTISLKGFSDTYNSMGLGYAGLQVSVESKSRRITNLINLKNYSGSIFGLEFSQNNVDYIWSFGGQFLLGIYFNMSFKEAAEFFLKLGGLQYE